MDKLNLDSDTYKDEEIEQLFKLKRPFTHHDTMRAKKILITQINSNKSLGIEKQREILFFIFVHFSLYNSNTLYLKYLLYAS